MKEFYGSFSGCGTIFMTEAGALQALLEAGYTFKGGAGTSGGSIVWTLYAGGLNPEAQLKELTRVNFKIFEDKSKNPWDGLGLLEGKEIHKMLKEFLDVPLKELKYHTQIVTTDLEVMEEVVFDSTLHKDVIAADAVRASMAIQGLFKEHVVNGRSLSDGGISRNTPIDLLPDTVDTVGVKVVGGKFDPTIFKVEFKNSLDWLLKTPLNILNKALQKNLRIINCMMEANEKEHIEDVKFSKMILLTTDKNGLSFDHTKADLEKMFRDGYNQTKTWLKKKALL